MNNTDKVLANQGRFQFLAVHDEDEKDGKIRYKIVGYSDKTYAEDTHVLFTTKKGSRAHKVWRLLMDVHNIAYSDGFNDGVEKGKILGGLVSAGLEEIPSREDDCDCDSAPVREVPFNPKFKSTMPKTFTYEELFNSQVDVNKLPEPQATMALDKIMWSTNHELEDSEITDISQVNDASLLRHDDVSTKEKERVIFQGDDISKHAPVYTGGTPLLPMKDDENKPFQDWMEAEQV